MKEQNKRSQKHKVIPDLFRCYCAPRPNDFREGRLTPGSIAGELASSQSRLVHHIMHDPPRTRRSALRHARTLDVGLDVHQESIAVAYAPEERDAEVVCLGALSTC
jgi:hypothetical protein